MKIDIPRVVVAVNMVAYAVELDGKYLHVWVNPPKGKLQEYDDLVTELQAKELETAKQTLFPDAEKKENGSSPLRGSFPLQKSFDTLAHWLHIKREKKSDGIDEKLLAWYAEVWSQGPEDERWTVAELQSLEMQDPSFLSWMIAQTWQTRNEHVQRKKKV